jgi:hypothetical protein
VKPSTSSHRSWTAILVLVLVTLSSSVLANASDEQLRQTMADIALLNGQLSQRKADATGIREVLSARLKKIKNEAEHEWKEKGIKTHADALDNPRLFYDLKLIGEIQAYIDRYTQKIGYYRVACDRLAYLYQQADDDLKIVSTLSGMKVDALIAQAEKILNDYLPDAQTLVIHPGTVTVDPPEKIWDRLKKGRKTEN